MIKIQRTHHKFLENIEYNDDSMKRYLFNTYGSKCCYCESPLAYFEIEHFYPKGQSKKKNPKNKFNLLSLYEISKQLKKRFKSKSRYELLYNEQENLHLACKRCNIYKGTFSGYALSPNFYFDKKKWKTLSQTYIDSRFKYNYAYVIPHFIYEPFVEKLQLNGQNKIGKALLRRRILYLAETLLLLDMCVDLIIAQKNGQQNSLPSSQLHIFFFRLFKIVAKRFNKNAPFASMIIHNFGKSFISIFNTLSISEKANIKSLLY